MAVTLEDVAARAGVSPPTVSRVLRGVGSQVPISAATRERVLAAARDLGYRPNLIARSLVRGQTRTIGVVLREGAWRLRRVYNASLLAGITDVLAAQGYALALYFSACGRDSEVANHAALLQDGRVDGGLVVDSSALAEQQIADLERETDRFPFVLIGHRLPRSRLHWVAADDRGGAIAAVKHLFQLGHRHIAQLYNWRGHPGRERSAGYEQGLAGCGLEVRPEWLVPSEFASGASELADHTFHSVRALWAQREPPTALFVWNDYAALAALKGLQQAGLVVPRDGSVVGYNDFDIAALAQPALTTVRTPLYEQGALAAEVLLEVLANGSTQPVQRLLPTTLVARDSTGPAPEPRGSRLG